MITVSFVDGFVSFASKVWRLFKAVSCVDEVATSVAVVVITTPNNTKLNTNARNIFFGGCDDNQLKKKKIFEIKYTKITRIVHEFQLLIADILALQIERDGDENQHTFGKRTNI